MTVAHAGVPYKAPRQSLRYIPAQDARSEPPTDWENDDLGRPADAIHTISYSLEQFPGSQRIVILLCYGWRPDASLPAAVVHLKAARARCAVFTIGTFSEIPSVKQFAEDSGTAFHDLGESEDVPFPRRKRTGAAARPG